MEKELVYKVAITLLPAIGHKTAKKLIAYCGGIEAVFEAPEQVLLKIPGIGRSTVKKIRNKAVLNRAEQEVKRIGKNGIRPLFYSDREYPARLKQCVDSPVMLYTKGNVHLNKKKVVSIVGTRNASQYGYGLCEKIVKGLAAHDVLIVSGLAYGIDICAHRAAVKNGLSTVAVLAHGLDMIYPPSHRKEVQNMFEKGGLVSDFITGTVPEKGNFPERNRIVAGMADATIVIESPAKGGSLITADIAHSYSRDVFAVPGRATDSRSEGCNRLIKSNKAALVESARDIEYFMCWEKNEEQEKKQDKLFSELDPEEETVAKVLRGKESLGVDQLLYMTELPVNRLASLLLNLEFKGIIRSLPGNRYCLS